MQTEATALMTAAKHGDRDAFDRLVERCRGQAFHVARSLVGSRDDAMELSQEAFLKTYRARATYRDGEPFLPWFHRILRNTCFSFLRKRGRMRKRSINPGFGDDNADDLAWEIVDEDEPAPSEALELDERAGLFWQAFRSLSSRDREILALRHFEELAYQEIADVLEIPIGTVMSRLYHARRRLRNGVAPLLDEDWVTTEEPN
jgi:RNA polymerase sigma-70 factor (ECF subfamily)